MIPFLQTKTTRLLVILVICRFLVAIAIAHGQVPRQRVIPEQGGVPIPTRIQPDDEVVVIEPLFSPQTLPPKRTVKDKLQSAVVMSDLAVVIDVTDVEGLLNEQQTWIRTRITGRLIELLMSRDSSVSKGDRIQIQYPWSGEMRIGKALVRAGELLRVEPRRRYFVFLRYNTETLTWAITGALLRIDGDRLVNPWELEPGSKTRDPLHGLSYADVAKQVRRLAKELKVK
jgi:hypothetical protein